MAIIPKSAAKTAKSAFYTVITIDPEDSCIKFSSMTEGQKASLTMETKKCRTRLFDEEFFTVFTKFVNEYAMQHPSSEAAGVTLVLPNRGVTTDILSIPTLRKKKTEESLDVSVRDLYRNSAELKVNRTLVLQNKQYTSYYLSIMQNTLLTNFYGALATSKMIPQAVTFASSAMTNAVQTLVPKLHNATYLLMDIKANHTVFAFVSKGVTCGYYNLPFGFSILEHNTLAAEDMIMGHADAELLVLNAKAKAKAKQNMMNINTDAQAMAEAIAENEERTALEAAEEEKKENDGEDFDDEEEKEEDIFTSGAAASATASSNMLIKTLPKKQPRKLPKFMLRPAPHGEEEYAYENFRLFVKWALNLIAANKKKLWHEKPEGVFVNLPSEYNYLFEKVNEEKKENGISFHPLEINGVNEKILNNLETYGGFFTEDFNGVNNF